jgi:hypothetical protein
MTVPQMDQCEFTMRATLIMAVTERFSLDL